MHYHDVSDEEWMKRKDEIVETLGNFQNGVLQPISQRECFIHSLQHENAQLRQKRMRYSFWQRAFTKHDEVLELDRKIRKNQGLIWKTERELKRAYEHMRQEAQKIQHHWFDLVGIGYGSVKPRLTDADFERLDKRWAEAHPDEEQD